nr:DUF4440 domain-containing protein [uncultured Flavobacterium sp.]
MEEKTIAFSPESARKAIETKNEAFAKAMMSGDSAVLVDFYADDAKVLYPGAEMITGKEAIAKIISKQIKTPMKEFKLETLQLSGTEDNLIEIGTYSLGDGHGKVLDKGKYVCIFKKVGDQWKCHTDIWNSDMFQT